MRALEEEQRRKGEGRRRGEKKRKCEGRRRGEENVLVEEKKQGKCLTNGGQDNHMHLTWASSSIESTLFPLKFYREHPLSPQRKIIFFTSISHTHQCFSLALSFSVTFHFLFTEEMVAKCCLFRTYKCECM